MKDILIVLVGSSGAGKTKISEYLRDHHNFRILKSYTTRPKRADSKDDHIYIKDEDVAKIHNKKAYNKYNGHHYFATEEQCDKSDAYVCDVAGLKQLKENYNKKIILSIYVETSHAVRIQRMRLRGDSEEFIEERLNTDKKEFENVKEECDFIVNNDYGLCIATQQILSYIEKIKREHEQT